MLNWAGQRKSPPDNSNHWLPYRSIIKYLQMLKPEHFSSETLLRHFDQDPENSALIVGFCLLAVVLFHFIVEFREKTNNNRTYKWFLFNGVFIHLLMDGVVGYLHLIKP
jgi:hypothetical protein